MMIVNNMYKDNINNMRNMYMNQILEQINTKKKTINIIYKIQFFIFLSIALIFIFILYIRFYKRNTKENYSQILLSTYNVSTIYSNNTRADVIIASPSTTSFVPFVIGIIKIDKINVNYPILSETTNELLDISLCRFAGAMPNEIGNLCIAGHNYVDYKFFSRLHELEFNDIIKIYDLNGNMMEYSVFDKYETHANDMSCTSQNTNGQYILTLLTCNNVSGKRLVVVANKTT